MRGVLALMQWSMRLDARGLRSHLLRLVFVFTIFFAMCGAFTRALMVGAPGRDFFSSICYLNFAVITLAGVVYFSTALTEEKEADSLALLRLAGLNPLSILLGKSTSRLIEAGMLLAVQFPFTLLAITLGGITLPQIFAAYLSLFGWLLLVANLALVCSVLCRQSGTAAGVTTIVVACLLMAPSLAQLGGHLATLLQAPPGITLFFERASTYLTETSVLHRLTTVLATGFNTSVIGRQVMFGVAGAGAAFVFSWLLFEWATAGDPQPARLVARPRTRRSGTSNNMRVWKNAFAWKDFHFLTGGRRVLAAKTVCYSIGCVMICILTATSDTLVTAEAGTMIATGMTAALVIECSLYSARIFFDEVRLNALTSLMLLPISTRRIAWSKVAGCSLALLPVLIWLCFGLVFAAAGASGLDILTTVGVTGYCAVVLVTFLHLTALFSLYVKWGALPLALVVTSVFNGCCPMFLMAFFLSSRIQEETVLWGLAAGVFLAATYWLVVLFPIEHEIANRLERLAADS